MGNPFAHPVASGRKSRLALIVAALAIAALAAASITGVMHRILPGLDGVALASSPGGSGQEAQAVPAELDILYARFSDAWKAGDWNQSIAALTSILAIDAANAAMRDRLCQAHLNLGWQLLAARSFEESRGQFELARQLLPSSAEARDALALLTLLIGGGGPPPAPTALPTVVSTPTPQAPVVSTPVPQAAVVCPTQVAVVCPLQAVVVCPLQAVVVCPIQVPVVACPTTFICHIVQRGDTLFSLARRFGTTVESIIAANHLVSTTIFVGQRLLIPVCPTVGPAVCAPTCPTVCPSTCPPVCPTVSPPVCPTVCPTACPPVCQTPCPPVCPAVSAPACPGPSVIVHVVRRGDDLFRLAIRFNVSVARLMQVNCLTTTSLRVGQVLIIA